MESFTIIAIAIAFITPLLLMLIGLIHPGIVFTSNRGLVVSRFGGGFLFIAVILGVVGLFVAPSVKKTASSKANSVKHAVVYNSSWDGSVSQIEDYLQRNLNDPSSLQIVEWSKVIKGGEYFMVRVKYRAKNAFGAYIIQNQIFSLDKTGKVVLVSDYQ
ncbi:hypothetical protein [Mariprofundus ferrooxydans]|uniref:Uncharacterized protein n=1 Tax=Mariprofundus ferrooxydans PV-1 TaxID=314345 RepID=Q0EWA4_9PROT|nr:hypothetical protein [Mariprofundus ferrooxydans]EAU53567.1 hypothetical protein SPV1_02978 [Mariprofundus ferrooxydans PV-1]